MAAINLAAGLFDEHRRDLVTDGHKHRGQDFGLDLNL
jgi:hypothetical protein